MTAVPISKIAYRHPPLDVANQIALLKAKGLVIANLEIAEYWLTHISYFRFKQYSYQFKDYKNSEGNYLPGTSFEQIRDLYLFDRKLKMIVFEAIESIEISVKTQLSNSMAVTNGPHWYLDDIHFISQEDRKQIIRNARRDDEVPFGFNHSEFLNNIAEEMSAPEEIFLQQYKKQYNPLHPPSWMVMEILTFGTFSRMFENLRPSPEKTALCDSFKLTKKHLVSWLHCFSFIRNRCAHHARLVFTNVKFAPAMPQKRSRQFLNDADLVANDSMYAVLCCLQYMLSFCNKHSSFKTSLLQLAKNFPTIDLSQLGFTEEWMQEPFWN